MIDPPAIMIPILLSVLPKPSDSVFKMTLGSKPPIKPIIKDAKIRTRKGWILYFAVLVIIKAMVTAR